MRVTLIAATTINDLNGFLGYTEHGHVQDADELAEFAGRACYMSQDRPSPKTATSQAYLRNIIDQQHFSVLEHASASFLLEGVSRSLTHELVRHRHLSFSQQSQRYVDESGAQAVRPPAVDDNEWAIIQHHMALARVAYEDVVDSMTLRGVDRKTARGAARSVLPNATETTIIVSGNLRAWREVIAKRSSPAADAEIRELAGHLLTSLTSLAPGAFQDF